MDKYQTLREKDNPSNNVYPNIKSQNIPSLAITTDKLAPNAVTAGKIGNYEVSTLKIAPNAVTEPKIASGAVTTTKIADNAITANKIADGEVTRAKLNQKFYDYTDISTQFPTIADFLTFMSTNRNYINARVFVTIDGFDCECQMSYDFLNAKMNMNVYVFGSLETKDTIIDSTNYATDFVGAKARVLIIE